jgi:hypothetical protein
MQILIAITLVAAFFAGFGYMQRLAAKCPGEASCDGQQRSAGCGACDLAREKDA